MNPIGILGGMGPEASADVYLKLIKRAYQRAAQDMNAYPHILINNLPTPDIFQRPDKETGIYLGKQARILEAAGARAIGVACNSAHYFWAEMRAALSPNIWLVDMIDEVAARVKREGHRQIGVLCSSMARPLYERAIVRHACQAADQTHSEQAWVDWIIARILAGERTPELKGDLRDLADGQRARGADCVVLGCTDLPILLDPGDVAYPLFASNDVLADVLFEFAVQ